jgi:hypothetical protein
MRLGSWFHGSQELISSIASGYTKLKRRSMGALIGTRQGLSPRASSKDMEFIMRTLLVWW